MKKVILTFLLSMHSLSVTAFDADVIPFNDIDDIPNLCLTIVQKLNEQPERSAIKKLLLPTYEQAKLTEVMTDAANVHLHDACKSSLRALPYKNDIRHRFFAQLQLSNPQRKFYGPDSLKYLYQFVVDCIKSDWTHTTANRHSDILFKHAESDWVLFMKKIDSEEDFFPINTALKFVIGYHKLGFVTSLEPGWDKKDGKQQITDNMYLWIKKDSFNKVQEKLKLSIE